LPGQEKENRVLIIPGSTDNARSGSDKFSCPVLEEIHVYSGVPPLSLGAVQRESGKRKGNQDTLHRRHAEECEPLRPSERFDDHPRQVRGLCVARVDPVPQSPQTRGNGIANLEEIEGWSVQDATIFSHHVKVGAVGLEACDVNMQGGFLGKFYRQIVQRMFDSLGQK